MARWITGLPKNTRTDKLLQCAYLPHLHIFLDYLSRKYAVRTLFLPDSHILFPSPTPIPNAEILPGIHRIRTFTHDMAHFRLENRQNTYTGSIQKYCRTIHLDRKKQAKMVHLRWISSLDDHTIVIYSDGSKLEGKHTGAGWASFYVQNGQLHLISSDACYLGTQAEVYDAEVFDNNFPFD
jgi:hypothetical protein